MRRSLGGMSAGKRILKMVLIVTASVVALAVVAVGGLFAYTAIDKEDRFYLVDAEPSDPDYLFTLDADSEKSSLDRERFGFAVHRLKRGMGVVFGYRFYSSGSVTVIDDELYRKVTIWIQSGAPQSQTELNLRDRAKAIVMFSRGASAWPRNDCSGYVSSGSLRVEHRGARYAVSVHGQLEPHGNSEVWKNCIPQRVDVEFEARQRSFDQLTPWLGLPGSHPYDETYR